MYIMLVGCYVLVELAEKLALKAGLEQLPVPHFKPQVCLSNMSSKIPHPRTGWTTNSVTWEKRTARQPESKLTDPENK